MSLIQIALEFWLNTVNKELKMAIYGWQGAPNDILENYSLSCANASKNLEKFSNFKQDQGYRAILEGAPKLFSEYYIQKINSHDKRDLFYGNLDKFKENDSIGNPDLYEEPDIGKISPSTLKYSFNCIDIISYIENYGSIDRVKNIVEIGGGYGGLCLILSNFIDFESYTLVDIPEACNLAKKYLSNFDKLKSKIKYIPCNKIDTAKLKDFDLTIAINSLSECDIETQLKYFEKFVHKSNLSYIIRNNDGGGSSEQHSKTLEFLPSNFSTLDEMQVEEWYSNNIIVRIKKDD